VKTGRGDPSAGLLLRSSDLARDVAVAWAAILWSHGDMRDDGDGTLAVGSLVAPPKEEIRSGDVVYIEPGEEHWHGATPDRFMAHVAVQEADQNGQLTWDTSPGSSRWASNRALAR
jgi:hypothetical protein